MMQLRDDQNERFTQDLTALEESLKMPYITSVERIAEARGEANVILRQLRKLCGPLPEGVEARVRKLPTERLEALGEAVLGLRSLQDLEAWLDASETSVER
jgi:hypothetical protein